MNWELISAVVGILSLILTVFLDWPRINIRIRESIIENRDFQQLVNIISFGLFVSGWIMIIIITRPFGAQPTFDKNFAFWDFLGFAMVGIGGFRLPKISETKKMLFPFGFLAVCAVTGLLLLLVIWK